MSEKITPQTIGLFDTPANKRIILEIQESGNDDCLLPAVRSVANVSFKHDFSLQDIDWIVFMDIFAVDHFLAHLGETDTDLFELDGLTIFANGEAVSDRLRFSQLHADVIPRRTDPESGFDAIRQYLGGETQGTRVLIVEEAAAASEIARLLSSDGTLVTHARVYKLEFDESPARAKTLITGGAIDQIVLTSQEDFIGLRAFAGGQPLAEFLREINVLATTGDVFQTLIESGLRPLYFQNKK